MISYDFDDTRSRQTQGTCVQFGEQRRSNPGASSGSVSGTAQYIRGYHQATWLRHNCCDPYLVLSAVQRRLYSKVARTYLVQAFYSSIRWGSRSWLQGNPDKRSTQQLSGTTTKLFEDGYSCRLAHLSLLGWWVTDVLTNGKATTDN